MDQFMVDLWMIIKAIVKCHIKDENDEITGDISRFMCDHLEIVTDAVEE